MPNLSFEGDVHDLGAKFHYKLKTNQEELIAKNPWKSYLQIGY
jgi:hypothetical protein